MAIINISIPSELLDKVNKYKKIVNKNRSEFFAGAAELYFGKIDENIAFESRRKAVKKLMKINERIKKEGLFKGVDFVEEIRNLRQARTDELLKKNK
jgi:metal-responsive CopG/Arc/MetJ family transcriptional regulator